MLLDTYTPLKRINKYKLKSKAKLWITLGLQKSISVKNKLLTNFINKMDPTIKEGFHIKCKKYKIYPPPLCRKVNRLIMTNILKEIGVILRTHGNESNLLFR